MRKSILILKSILLLSTAHAQQGFNLSLNSGISHTTFHNKEDKKAGDLLKQKGQLTPAYGLDIGYMITKHLGISVGIQRQNYDAKYSGYDKDSVSIISFDATHRMNYLELPVRVVFIHPIQNRIYFGGAVGISFSKLLSYSGNFGGVSKVINTTNTLVNSKQTFLNKESNLEIYYLYNPNDVQYVKYNFEKALYASSQIQLSGQIHGAYALNDKLLLQLSISYRRGITDIENKVLSKVSYVSSKSGYNEGHEHFWEHTNKYRYYYRPPSDYGTRPATYTQAIGAGLSLCYYFKGGLLPSMHTGKH